MGRLGQSLGVRTISLNSLTEEYPDPLQQGKLPGGTALHGLSSGIAWCGHSRSSAQFSIEAEELTRLA